MKWVWFIWLAFMILCVLALGPLGFFLSLWGLPVAVLVAVWMSDRPMKAPRQVSNRHHDRGFMDEPDETWPITKEDQFPIVPPYQSDPWYAASMVQQISRKRKNVQQRTEEERHGQRDQDSGKP